MTAISQVLKASNLSQAQLTIRSSHERGYSSRSWLESYHSFAVQGQSDPSYVNFSSLRALNEDRVAPLSGFPTHYHSNMEIFTYMLDGTLTHRDSTVKKGQEKRDVEHGDQNKEISKDLFYNIKRGDVQFTTAGSGIGHSEENEDEHEWAHLLQIWIFPWKKDLAPRYHNKSFSDKIKRKAFVTIVSPLKAGPGATVKEEVDAVPVVEGSIPIHADCYMGAAIIPVGDTFQWRVGGPDIQGNRLGNKVQARKVHVHLPMVKGGKARILVLQREGQVLHEGDGGFLTVVFTGECIEFTSVGEAEAEIVVLDLDEVGNGP